MQNHSSAIQTENQFCLTVPFGLERFNRSHLEAFLPKKMSNKNWVIQKEKQKVKSHFSSVPNKIDASTSLRELQHPVLTTKDV